MGAAIDQSVDIPGLLDRLLTRGEQAEIGPILKLREPVAVPSVDFMLPPGWGLSLT